MAARKTYEAGPLRRPPSHPGAVVRSSLEACRTSIRLAAAAMGVSHAALAQVVTEKAAVSPEMALRLGRYLGNGPTLWLRMQEAHDLWHAEARLADELAAIVPLEPQDLAG